MFVLKIYIYYILKFTRFLLLFIVLFNYVVYYFHKRWLRDIAHVYTEKANLIILQEIIRI